MVTKVKERKYLESLEVATDLSDFYITLEEAYFWPRTAHNAKRATLRARQNLVSKSPRPSRDR